MSEATKNLRPLCWHVTWHNLRDAAVDDIERLAWRVAQLERQGKDAPVETHGHSTTGVRADGAESPVAGRTPASPPAPAWTPQVGDVVQGDMSGWRGTVKRVDHHDEIVVEYDEHDVTQAPQPARWFKLVSRPAPAEDWKSRAERAEAEVARLSKTLEGRDAATWREYARTAERAEDVVKADLVAERKAHEETRAENCRLAELIGPMDSDARSAEKLKARSARLLSEFGICGPHNMSALETQLRNAVTERDALRAELADLKARVKRVKYRKPTEKDVERFYAEWEWDRPEYPANDKGRVLAYAAAGFRVRTEVKK